MGIVDALDARAQVPVETPVVLRRVWNGVVPPRYERTKLGPLARPRDKWWRRDAHIALDEALAAGEIPVMVGVVVRVLLSFSDDSGEVVWPSWATIGSRMQRSGRTAGEWLRLARDAGWVEREHRWRRLPGGVLAGQSNLWRVKLPAAGETRRLERKRDGKTVPTPRAPQNRGRGPQLRGSQVRSDEQTATAFRSHAARVDAEAQEAARLAALETPATAEQRREILANIRRNRSGP